MVVGRILQRCAEEMRERLGTLTPREYLRRHGPLVVTKEYERPREMSWDDTSYQGDAYGSYGWGCDVVEVEVDRDTWEVDADRVHDASTRSARRSIRCSPPGRSKAAARRGSATRCSRRS